MFEKEFQTYDLDTPEVRALQHTIPASTFALVEGLMGRWQQAGMPLKPSRRGFAFQAPHGNRLTTVAWIYGPDSRNPLARLEIALGLLRRRGTQPDRIEALRDDLTRFPTHVPAEDDALLVQLQFDDTVTSKDMGQLASTLVKFGLSLA